MLDAVMSLGDKKSETLDAGRPTIAVLLSNYNHAEHLERALAGIFGQTRPADEVLLLDDGSTDGSLEILRAYAGQYSSATLLEHKENRGLLVSIAALLKEATADYVVWAASDDELLPKFLEESEKVLRKYPGIGVCFSEFSVVHEAGAQPINYSRDPEGFGTRTDRAHAYRLYDIPELLTRPWLIERYSTGYLCMSSNTALMNRKKLVDMGGFTAELEWYADWFAVAALAFRHGACVVPQSLAVMHAGAGSFSSTGMRNARQQRRVLHAWLRLLMEEQNSDLKRMYTNAPAVFAPFDHQMILAGVLRPRFWSLAFANFRWYIFGWPSRSGLSWPQLAKKALIRLVFRQQ